MIEELPECVETELLIARRELALERRAKQIRLENQITFFTPHPKQCLFFANSHYHYRYARTGNRFGKSEMGACEDISFALGYRPWYPVGDPLRTLGIPPHPTKGLIVTTDWDKSKEVFTEIEGENKGKLFKYIPAASLGSCTKNHSGAIDRILVKHISGGWSVIHLDTVKSYKQNPLGQESSVWDWVHIDEPCPNGMWKAIVRGLTDRKGKAWFTCTPISEPWIDMEFVPNIEDQSKENLGVIASDETSRWMMTGSMDDNPYNSPESIALTLSWYTEEEREARRKGVPVSYAGIIYKEFDWNLHVSEEVPSGWESWDRPPSSYCIRFAIDYHFRKPNAILFIATSPEGISYIYAEIWELLLVEEEVMRIKLILAGHVPQPGLVDPLASTPNKINETCQMDEYRRLGLPVLPATKDPVNGIREVRAQLKSRDKRGLPTLFFRKSLKRTLFEISRGFIWDGEEDRPVKKNDDMMENLYRICMNGQLEYVEPATDNDYAPISARDIASNVLDFPDVVDLSGFNTDIKPDLYSTRYRR